MIVMQIKGGLGNQMFQYAAGRALSLQTGMPLHLDLRYYRREREHGYGLGAFNIEASPLDESLLPPLPRESPLAWLIWRLGRRGPNLVRENGMGFNPTLSNVTKPAWITGYFQSERYFAAHAATIRAELTPVAAPDLVNARWLAEIAAEPRAVSLHVRRGDYVRDAKAAAKHGSCTPAYYERALAHITARMGTAPVVYAFSDDPAWVRENLRLPAEIRVPGHNDTAGNVEDLRLMSACRHHIVANSSFSWWGAWLNPRADKIVASPARWFADPAFTNPDIWPEAWARIEG
ncbi:alpha-1,2-fucosyltransferase [Pseudorhodobacter ferrugineus]|uniref:alpha-1,2-fucosyltransferase n=1 Tax=Pseudorhodobacter ferrugineus TaxID=77008 RepID=UPI0003B4C197|nr:alpha-1,2-fucosyltransferase [Pseudorhodobacter ferrugineus]